MIVRMLEAPAFSEGDRDLLLSDLLALKKDQIRDFLGRHKLLRAGRKDEIRCRVEEALADETLSLSQLVEFLDEVIPWGKQHVLLYKGPQKPIADWRKKEWFEALLTKHRAGKYLNAKLPLVLPERMQLSSILYDQHTLRVTAIKRRDWAERLRDKDDFGETEDGLAIEYRAYVNRVTRSVVVFEWNLKTNVAMLQISQLPSGHKYERAAEEFFKLIANWLDVEQFQTVDLRPAIKRLHELEETKKGETRSHGIKYRTLQGRALAGTSPSAKHSLLGERDFDAALSSVRKKGVGHLGNFYWLPANPQADGANPLSREAHVVIVASNGRINFPTPNAESTVRHVLSRIRKHSP